MFFFAVIFIHTSILPFKSFGVRIMSLGGNSVKLKNDNNSFGNISFEEQKKIN